MRPVHDIIDEIHLNNITSALTRDFVKMLMRDKEQLRWMLADISDFRDYNNHEACLKVILDLQKQLRESDIFN